MSGSKRVSVIITNYNHAHYLPQSIDSVLQQGYPNLEIILVDDGSTDNSKAVASQYPQVNYVYQHNQGLSAARNTGIEHSTGDYLVFLDADDWFLEDALTKGIAMLAAHPDIGFVYGRYIDVNEEKVFLRTGDKYDMTENHYRHLLHYNFIGMHAAVFYQRWVFNRFRFDPSLKACEDYDMYLKIARNYPIMYNDHLVAAYRRRSESMSGNIPLMISTGLEVMRRQLPLLKNEEEKKWSAKGVQFWKKYYGKELYRQLMKSPFLRFHRKRRHELIVLFTHHRPSFIRYIREKTSMYRKSVSKKKIPSFLSSIIHPGGGYRGKKPAVGEIQWGDFSATKPFSKQFGYDRGGPVDRYYIENFLEKNADAVKGRVLEVSNNEYTLRFGGSKITKSDILHVDDPNPKATFVGDLSNAPQLPDNTYDCIILTQTLQFIYHHHEALRTCFRILKPGGSLLLTVPGITHNDQGEDWSYFWMWSYTQASLKRMLTEIFPASRVATQTFGNVRVAAAFLYGVGLPEIKKEEMDVHDPNYQVIITARATKPIPE